MCNVQLLTMSTIIIITFLLTLAVASPIVSDSIEPGDGRATAIKENKVVGLAGEVPIYSYVDVVNGCRVCPNSSSIEQCQEASTFAECRPREAACATRHYVDTASGEITVSRSCVGTCVQSGSPVEQWLAAADARDQLHTSCSHTVTAQVGCTECRNESSLQNCDENGIFQLCNAATATCKVDIFTSKEEGTVSFSRACSNKCVATPGADWQNCVATTMDANVMCTTCQRMEYKVIDENQDVKMIDSNIPDRIKRENDVEMTKVKDSNIPDRIKRDTGSGSNLDEGCADDDVNCKMFKCRVVTKTVSIDEGAVGTVDVKVDTPTSLLCQKTTQQCTVHLVYEIDQTPWPVCNGQYLQQLYIQNNCENTMTSSALSATFHVKVRGAMDMVVDQDQISAITAYTHVQRDREVIKIPCQGQTEVKVADKDSVTNVCKISGHFLTRQFDNDMSSIGPYPVRVHSLFRLYKHSTLPYEIQVAFATCFRNKTKADSCACAVNVRCEDTVIVFDNCIHIDNALSDNNQALTKKKKVPTATLR